jgi:hypothetical protein
MSFFDQQWTFFVQSGSPLRPHPAGAVAWLGSYSRSTTSKPVNSFEFTMYSRSSWNSMKRHPEVCLSISAFSSSVKGGGYPIRMASGGRRL